MFYYAIFCPNALASGIFAFVGFPNYNQLADTNPQTSYYYYLKRISPCFMYAS
jgi:hypothetical protein